MAKRKHNPAFSRKRRQVLQRGLLASGLLAVGQGLLSHSVFANPHTEAISSNSISNIPKLAGTLQRVAVENDPATIMLLPNGFSVREIARTGHAASSGSDYLWHGEPDGGAVFPTDDNGWIYVSNSEIDKEGQGGVGAICFDANGVIIDSYSICSGTTNNCAGGPTPWGTWLTCEEIDTGLVYECDPLGKRAAQAIPAMGAFTHEAAAVDPVRGHIYLTEDRRSGNLYRYIPDHYPAPGQLLGPSGRLEVAVVQGDNPLDSRSVSWAHIPYPVPQLKLNGDGLTPPATRKQVPAAEKFDGGEGCWYHAGIIYFTTKGDNRVWALDTGRNLLDLIYDKGRDQAFNPDIDDVDNVTVSSAGDILVAEDGAEMRLVVVGTGITPFELINVQGHRGSEITGPAFSPDGSRLYFSSQSGPAGTTSDGRTYEMTGPFFS